ncbi:putative metallopeptidase [Natroniella sp. ANB-PHB2]|uniref:putative metallopeptidase n=1 Tax=Natroniella sp. ANB-PHB2 TaxID=3384444 RepID=UPI0038D4FE26
MAKYFTAGIEQVEEYAAEVIKEDFEKLSNIKIGFQFREEARSSKGRQVYASPKKIPNKLHNFVDYDLIITIAKDIWSTVDARSKKAILDDIFRTIELIPKKAEIEGFPRRVAEDYWLLSDGRKIKGRIEAYQEQEKISDYDIKIYDHKIQADPENYSKYGAWRKDLKQMSQAVQQTSMNFKRAEG